MPGKRLLVLFRLLLVYLLYLGEEEQQQQQEGGNHQRESFLYPYPWEGECMKHTQQKPDRFYELTRAERLAASRKRLCEDVCTKHRVWMMYLVYAVASESF